MTTVAEEDVLTAAELDLTVDPITEDVATVTETADADSAGDRPAIRIVKGSPTDVEIAALICVLSAGGGEAVLDSGPGDAWGRPTLMHRGTSPFSPYAFPQLSHLR
ncbi:acyl-CoA carboxylase subunit epsilon [Nocardia takedensis]|uniref:acyl-CoA carboxylase subunit epsilon n=1 Tax=Nocardia takedensis TaxID=259390 RepID=UPI00031AB402|nr:acyl-CoA carboxylase subunit epsilon [Nocardia takedensis]